MKAIYFDLKMWKILLNKMKIAPKFLTFKYKEDWPLPKRNTGNQVLVKTLNAGICGSDLHQLALDMSYYASVLSSPLNPSPIGHEVIGMVEEISQNSTLTPGDRVVLNPTVYCAAYGFSPCPSCQKGDWQHCYTLVGKGDNSENEQSFMPFKGQTYGGYAEYFIAFEKNLYKVPNNIPNHVAVLIEPFTVALHAIIRNPPKNSDSLIIIGAGTIGLMMIAAIRALGIKSNITSVVRYKHQAELAKKLGADTIIYSPRDKKLFYNKVASQYGAHLVTPLMRKAYVYGATGPDIIYDTVATESTVEDALHIIRSRGKIIVIGMGYSITKKVDWAVQVYKEVEIVGSFLQSIGEYEGKIIDPYEFGLKYMSNHVDLFDTFVSHRFPLHEYKKAFGTLQQKRKTHAIKVIFDYT
jgi:threonine dehydrogenase-like Zn-dependent dehydrogenase